MTTSELAVQTAAALLATSSRNGRPTDGAVASAVETAWRIIHQVRRTAPENAPQHGWEP